MKKGTSGQFAAVVVASVAGLLLIPTPLRVQGTLVLKPSQPQEVYAEVPGRLTGLYVRDGEAVTKGTVLATLSNPQKLRDRTDLQEQHDSSFAKSLWFGQSPDLESRGSSAAGSRWPATWSRPSGRVPARSAP